MKQIHPQINTIAFMIWVKDYWLQYGDTVHNTLSDNDIKDYYKKWITEWVPELDRDHCGDCIKVPCPCIRCHMEDLIKQATRLYSLIDVNYIDEDKMCSCGCNKSNDEILKELDETIITETSNSNETITFIKDNEQFMRGGY